MDRRSALALLAGAAISGCRRAPRPLRTIRVTRIVAARDVAIPGCIHEVHGHRKSFPNGFQYSYAHFGRALLDGDIRSGSAFLTAYFRAVREFRAGLVPGALDRLAMESGMDPAAVRTACRSRLSQDGRIERASVQRMIDWSVKRGFIAARMDASQMIDSPFLDHAMRRGEDTQ